MSLSTGDTIAWNTEEMLSLPENTAILQEKSYFFNNKLTLELIINPKAITYLWN